MVLKPHAIGVHSARMLSVTNDGQTRVGPLTKETKCHLVWAEPN